MAGIRWELWSGPMLATGSVPIREVEVIRAEIERVVVGRPEASISVRRGSEWLPFLTPRSVLVRWKDGETQPEAEEWRVAGDRQTRGMEDPLVRIELDPIWAVLADPGPVEYALEGGVRWTNLGGVGLSARGHLVEFVIPWLEAAGIDWIRAGESDFPDRIEELTWDARNPLEIIRRLLEVTGAEFGWRRDGSFYRIDLLEQLGGEAEEVWVQEGVDLLQFERERLREGYATAIRPRGILTPGDEHRSTLGQAAFKVTDVTGDWLTLAPAPAQGGTIVLEDGQHVGFRVMRPDLILTAITASEAPDRLEVADPTGISVGDVIEFRGDDQGGLITTVDSPAAISFGGRVVDQVTVPDGRGERNYLHANPGLHDPPEAEVIVGRPDGAQDGTSWDLVDFPASKTIPAGSMLVAVERAANLITRFVRTITGEVTTSGAGAVTVALNGQAGTVLNPWEPSAPAVYLILAPNPRPASWSHALGLEAVLRRRGGMDGTGQVVVVDGAQSLGGTGSVQRLSLQAVPEDFELRAGDRLDKAGSYDGLALVMGNVTAGVAGTVQVPVATTTTFTALADNQELTVARPALTDLSSDRYHPTLLAGGGAEKDWLESTLVPLPSIAGASTARVRVGFILANSGRGPLSMAAGAGDHDPVQLEVRDNSDTLLVSVTAPEEVLPAGAAVRHYLSASFTVPSSGTVKVRIRSAGRTNGGLLQFRVIPLTVMLAVTTDEGVPFVDGAHGTQLFLAANRELTRTAVWPAVYRAIRLEWSRLWGIPLGSPSLQLGATARFVVPSARVDTRLRIMGILETEAWDGRDGEVARSVELRLDTRPDLLTDQVRRAQAPDLYVNVEFDIQVDAGGQAQVRRTQIASEEPPTVIGVPRAVVAEGQPPPSGDNPLGIIVVD